MIVDAAIVGFIGFFVWRGIRRGLLSSLTGLIGFVVATAAAVFTYPVLSPVFREALRMSAGIADITSALAIFVGVTAAFWYVGRHLTRVLRPTKLGMVNAAGGGALSAAWALSWVTVVVLAASVVPAPNAVASAFDESRIARGIERESPSFAARIARTDLRALIASVFPSVRMVAVTATSDFRRLDLAEQELLDLVNVERTKRKLRALRWDEALARAARAHAADMYRNGYFDHDSLDGTTPAERATRAGARFRSVGENLALAPSVVTAHAQLMRSKRHRDHILRAQFTKLGIGVMYGRQGFLVVQEFAS